MALPIYTHIPNLKVLTKIFFKLSRPKGNLCGSGGGSVTVLNPKYPRLSSGDTNICKSKKKEEKSVAMATLVARCCRKANQLQSVQGYGKQRAQKNIYKSKKKKQKSVAVATRVARFAKKLIRSSLCRGTESKEPIKYL